MTISMMLRFIHAVLTNDAERFGHFKLRGVRPQFMAALVLYRLIVKSQGDVPTNSLDWATHDILETLLKPLGLGTRPIDCPTDQMAFLWALLSRNCYRISKDLSSLMSSCKFGFRCIEIHSARIQSQKLDKSFPFYDSSASMEIESDGEGPEALQMNQHLTSNSSKLTLDALLEKVNNINAEGMWSSSFQSQIYVLSLQILWTFHQT
jgi:hypothetical protein